MREKMKNKISEIKILGFWRLLFPLMVLWVLLGACQQNRGENELREGLYLKYQEIVRKAPDSESVIWSRAIDYQFHGTANEELEIIQTIQTLVKKELKQGVQILNYPQPGDDLSIDSRGVVIKGGDNINFIDGYPSYLWLPPKYRKEGASVFPVLMKVGEKKGWNGLDVWPVIVAGKPEIQVNYYEAETGILIGIEKLKGKIKLRLVETNHKFLMERFLKSNVVGKSSTI